MSPTRLHESELTDPVLRELSEEGPAHALDHLGRLGLKSAAGLTELLDRAEALTHHDPLIAERLTIVCDAAASVEGLPDLQARARYQRAQILAERGELDVALDLVGQAHDLWSSAGDTVAALRTGLGRMHLLDDLGRHADAVRLGQELVASLDALAAASPRTEGVDKLRAHATENLGVAYGFTGQHREAMEAYASAEAQYRRLGMHAEAGRPLASRGVELLAWGRPREALEELRRAHEVFAENADELFAAQCLGDLAQAHRQLGEFGQALHLLDQARTTLLALNATVEAHRVRLALAETYLDAGLWVEARQTAEEIAEATAEAGLVHDSAMARYIGALADLGRGRADLALEGLTVAARLFGDVNDSQHAARTQLAWARAADAIGSRDRARALLDQCIPALRQGGWLTPLACAYLHQCDLAAHPPAARRALDAAQPLVSQLDLPELTYQFELRAGHLCRQEGLVDQAEEHLRAAIFEVDKLSGRLPDHVLRIAFRAERLSAHAELVDLMIDRGGETECLAAARLADASKVQTLRELLAQPGQPDDRDRDAGDRESSDMPEELTATYAAIEATSHPGTRSELARKADLLERDFTARQLARSSRALNPYHSDSHLVADATPGKAHPPTLAFHVVGDDILLFVTVAGRTSCRRLRGALSQTHTHLDALADQWSRFALGLGLGLSHRDSLTDSTQATLGALYTLLIAPIADLIGPGPGALRVVPHGPMGAVPFHALFDGQHYLVETWTVTVAPTHAAALASDDNPVDCAAPTVVVAVADEYAPAVRTEAGLVADLLPDATLLVDDRATVAGVTEAIRTGTALVHFACHGTHPRENPLFSRLRLGDRWLTSSEIVRLDLSGAVVALSACESGAHGRSAEPIGLGWAFLAAGAAGVLVSLWEVHDEATCTLAAELYRLLVDGTPPAEALRRAQLHTAEHYPHPYYWAPFSFITAPLSTEVGEPPS